MTIKMWQWFGISCCLLAACTSKPTISQTHTWLFFTEKGEDQSTYYRLDLDEEYLTLQPILTIPKQASGYRAYLSPDAHYMALRYFQELLVIDLATGNEIIRLEVSPLEYGGEFLGDRIENELVWSPNGQQLLFLVESPYLRRDIMLLDMETLKVRSITNDPSRENAPTWSPDGEQIAFAVWQACGDTLENCSQDQVHWDIGIISADGTDYRIVTDETVLPQSLWWDSSLCHLSWSPDEKSIVFQSFCPNDGIPNWVELFAVATDGSQTRQLTQFGNVDYVNSFTIEWLDEGTLLVGYNHDFIFDDLNDERGFGLFAHDIWQAPQNIPLPLLRTEGANWSEDHRYVIGNTSDYGSTVLGERQQEGISILRDDLPAMPLGGVWVMDQYFTQMGNHVVKIMAPGGEVVDLGVQLSKEMELFAWRKVEGK